MPRFPLLAGAALLALTSHASASSFVATTDALGSLTVKASESTSDISSFDDDKIVLAARDDAASFVASEGQIRGAQLEAALRHIRQQAPQVQAGDLQLAQAILTL